MGLLACCLFCFICIGGCFYMRRGVGCALDCMFRCSLRLYGKVSKGLERLIWMETYEKCCDGNTGAPSEYRCHCGKRRIVYFNPEETVSRCVLGIWRFLWLSGACKVGWTRAIAMKVLRDAEREMSFSDPWSRRGAVRCGGRVWLHGWGI